MGFNNFELKLNLSVKCQKSFSGVNLNVISDLSLILKLEKLASSQFLVCISSFNHKRTIDTRYRNKVHLHVYCVTLLNDLCMCLCNLFLYNMFVENCVLHRSKLHHSSPRWQHCYITKSESHY